MNDTTAPIVSRFVACKSDRVNNKHLFGYYSYLPKAFAAAMALTRRELEDALVDDLSRDHVIIKQSHFRGYSKEDLAAVYAASHPVK